MPKVVLIPEDKTKEQMLRCIDSKLAYYGMCKKDLAKAMDVSGKTVTNRTIKNLQAVENRNDTY